MSSPQLGITHVTVSQSNKEATINAGFDKLDNSMNRVLSKTVTGDFTVTNAEFLTYGLLYLTGSPGSTFIVRIPAAIARRWMVLNLTGADAIVENFDAGTDAVVLGQGLHTIFTDGADIFSMSGGDVSTGGSSNPNVVRSELTASGNVTNTHLSGQQIVNLNAATAQTLTIPSGLTNKQPVTFIQTGGGVWTIDEPSDVSVLSKNGDRATAGLYSAFTIVPQTASNTYIVIGDLT